MRNTRTPREQLEVFRSLLKGEQFPRTSPLFERIVVWAKNFPGDLNEQDKKELLLLIQRSFNLTEDELRAALAGVPEIVRDSPTTEEADISLMAFVPNGGYLHDYIRYTQHSEAPLAYHIFCALVGVGATINRRVWFDMGYFRLFCNLGVILIGPSGLKKTTASDIIVSMLQELELTKIYSEKLTPEALVEAMRDMAQGLIYAPEMSVFLGKARYMEGIVPLITRFMDCPDRWSSETIMRSKTYLHDVAISVLMCSTPDWFVSNTPEDLFGGGFFARSIHVVQEDTSRCESKPKPGDPTLRTKLIIQLAALHELTGEMIMSPECDEYYDRWYRESKKDWKNPENELLATYFQRKGVHTIRIAMNLHLSEHGTLIMCLPCFKRALGLVEWTEKLLPSMLRKMFKTAQGAEQDYVRRAIAGAKGGVIDHSILVRKVQYRMNAQQLRAHVLSLKEGRIVEERHDKLQHVYVLCRED